MSREGVDTIRQLFQIIEQLYYRLQGLNNVMSVMEARIVLRQLAAVADDLADEADATADVLASLLQADRAAEMTRSLGRGDRD